MAKIISAACVGTERIQRETEVFQSFQNCGQNAPFLGVSYPPGRPDVLAMVTEFVEGGNLEVALRAKILNSKQIWQILQDVLWGMQALHAADVIHRNIKPSNFLLNEQCDHAFLCDLGASPLVETGVTHTALYTEGYVTEEARSGNAQKASDVFSFGVVLREADVGTKSTGDAPWLAVRDDKFDVRGIGNPAVAALVAECVQRDPAARPKIDVVLGRFRSVDPESLLVNIVESTGTRTIRFREADDPAVCGFEANESQTLAEVLDAEGLKGRLYDQKGLSVPLRKPVGKLDPNVIYVLR